MSERRRDALERSADRRAAGVLYIVATPIGNLEDVSARALRVLGEVAVIACEDTRHSARLLSTYGIRTPTVSYFEHNEERRTPELIGAAAARRKHRVDQRRRHAGDLRSGLPAGARGVGGRNSGRGDSGTVSGDCGDLDFRPADRSLHFRRFSAAEGERAPNARWRRSTREPRTMVFFEAARRLEEPLADMAASFGAAREAAVVREISKTFEECVRGTLPNCISRFSAAEPRGEIVVVVAGAPTPVATDVPLLRFLGRCRDRALQSKRCATRA